MTYRQQLVLIALSMSTLACGEAKQDHLGQYQRDTASAIRGPLLFAETFDQQPDWSSGMYSTRQTLLVENGDTLPTQWFSAYQEPVWAASKGYSGGHENIEILQSNRDKTKQHTGKSLVFWRDSTGAPSGNWNSDGQLTKYFAEGYRELYVKFDVRFDPNWTANGKTGMTKLFRLGHWNGQHPIYKFFEDGNSGPIMIWDYDYNDVASRLALTLRGYPIQSNYRMTNPAIANWPRQQGSMNFKKNIRDLDGDGREDNQVTQLFSAKDGSVLNSDWVEHEELWGEQWRTIEFYVKMNSAPGQLDGQLWMWMDGQLVVKNTTVPWAGSDAKTMPRWNFITFGGNAHFHAYSSEMRRQEWYAFDNIEVYRTLTRPNPALSAK